MKNLANKTEILEVLKDEAVYVIELYNISSVLYINNGKVHIKVKSKDSSEINVVGLINFLVDNGWHNYDIITKGHEGARSYYYLRRY